MKQTPSGAPTKVQDVDSWLKELDRFLRDGWSAGILNKY